MNVKELSEKVAVWAQSPEGQRQLQETAAEVRAMREKLNEERRLDHKILMEPMTI